MLEIRDVRNFDHDWKFRRTDDDAAFDPEYYDADWETVTLPHDWSIQGPFDEDAPAGRAGGFLPGGTGWYRKRFEVGEDARDTTCILRFDGVYRNSEVWINGHYQGKCFSGYASFQYDVTPYIDCDTENVIAVRVDNSDQPNCRWYTGSGIYRHVHLIKTGRQHVDGWGTYVVPELSGKTACAHFNVKIDNTLPCSESCNVAAILYGPEGKIVAETDEKTLEVDGDNAGVLQFDVDIQSPQLWAPEHPVLYTAHLQVTSGGAVVDDYTIDFGIRGVEFSADRGLVINGRKYTMKGVCLHHDAGCLGAAVPKESLERRLKILDEMGCNAIRTSHNPPAPELLRMCDRMGFLVIDEAFDKWFCETNGYGEAFEELGQKDLQRMIDRDRNHPSVVMWSVGNEVEEQGSERMIETLKELTEFVREYDPSRPVTCALFPEFDKSREEIISDIVDLAENMDVLSGNYYEQWYEDIHEAMPELPICGSETFPYFRGKERPEMFFQKNPWFDVEEKDYVVGQFLWAGIDYLGEAGKWPSKGWGAAPINTCGFRKPRSFFHQSQWTETPMVHMAVFDDSLDRHWERPHWSWPKIASHWNFPRFEDGLARLVTYSNCEEVELILNGKSFGLKCPAEAPNRMLTWYVPYQKGTIRANGVNSGEVVCSHVLKTSDEPVTSKLEADKKKIRADQQDVAHIRTTLIDKNGTRVPDDDRKLCFNISGPGRIAGVDNGNLMSGEPFTGTARRTHRGRCLVIVQSTRDTGEIKLSCSGRGIEESAVTVHTVDPSVL